MSFIPAMMYIIGLVAFGIFYWLLDGILDILIATNIADTTTYGVYPLLLYFWSGLVICYLIFGGIWVVRTYNEKERMGGFY